MEILLHNGMLGNGGNKVKKKKRIHNTWKFTNIVIAFAHINYWPHIPSTPR